MYVLVSFLGRTPRNEDGYRQTTYRLPDGTREQAAYLGYCLQRWQRPDRLVILGTAGSMWDHLFERDVDLAGQEEEKRLELGDWVDRQAVTQEHLDALTPLLAASLGCEIELRIIPEALKENEQVALLQILDQATEGATHLSIDVTHAYRHLPMIALTAALYLRAARPELAIEGLWYGAYRPETATAEVCDLSGLLNITAWIEALQRHDWLGDYGAVAELIKADHATVAENLRQAAFCESIHQGQRARGLLKKARNNLHEHPLSGPGALFQPLLEERMKWVDGNYLYERQRTQALNALRQDDYLRASLYGFEAFITKLAQERGFVGRQNEQAERETAKEWFETEKPASYTQYQLLRKTRNALAHGDKAKSDRVQQALASPQRLRALLEECFTVLLPEQTP
ncbi:TIGR02221 family CRISPR-associated protein [Nitrococcus mobilis]|uniref:CRISPR-associated protein, TM1812 family n=1 Tax=Nitrococcus mobilis Nb-231 TaxID=314278 RepID=A4BL61_9GAMM|nr:TIGR02221 family CRISPR-associated protein [Nitrococcus mobilis]EAR23049.1 possible M. jannaschii predicted coding region MJ1674 [Nitrococcus mobilis Nb-231]